ncbi:DUF1152 domain-containing protein [Nitrosomonas communis]|nr:DUF1152 domain-containing protein [Nitrosomonas communis]
MTVVPFDLPEQSRVLMAGAGGGFDVVCGMPIVFELAARGHKVFLANYSFTDLRKVSGASWLMPNLLEIGSNAASPEWYFPELYVTRWYANRNETQSIFCFDKQGVAPTAEAYQHLVQKLSIDTVICVDGGIDGLFRGDETDLGTPSMDSISVLATHLSGADRRYYATTAFGVEGAEGKVSHAQALRRMSELIAQDAHLGVGTVIRSTPTGKAFVSLVEYLFNQMPPQGKSTMASSLLAAMNGAFGRTPVNYKTDYQPPWLSPLTTLFWYFQADDVARMKLFYNEVLQTTTVTEVNAAIEQIHGKTGPLPFESIPI